MKSSPAICAALVLFVPNCIHSLTAYEAIKLTTPNSANQGFSDNRQKLGAGDRISYRVIEDQDETKSLTINDSGDVLVPYLGLVRAVGKTSLELSKEVKL